MNFEKRRVLVNSLFTLQSNYCPLVWMCHSRTMNNKINHLHERCLRIVYSDKTLSFEKLSEIDRSVPIHIKKRQILATEFFKESKNLAPTIFSEIFSKGSVQDNLRHNSEFSVPNVKSTFHGTEILSYLGPKIWDLVPKELRELSRLSVFQKAIKKWKPQNCPCRLSKKYIQNLGFI